MIKPVSIALLYILILILAWLFHWNQLDVVGVLVWIIIIYIVNMLVDSKNMQRSIEELNDKIQKLEKRE